MTPPVPALTTASATGGAPQPAQRDWQRLPGGRANLGGVIRAEWTKLRSVRSTTWTLLVLVVVTIGVGMLACWLMTAHWHDVSTANRATFDPTNQSLSGMALGQLAIGVLGVLVMTGEYASGLIRATLAVAPRRWTVLVAKAAVFGVVALVVGEVVAFVAFGAGQALLTAPVPHASLGDPGVLRAVTLAGAYIPLIGLVALGLGAIIRHTGGAIAAMVGITLVLPIVFAAFPASVQHSVGRFLPADIGSAMASVRPQQYALTPWAAFGVLCVYVGVALGIGLWLLRRRDA